MSTSPPSQSDLERVKALAHELGMRAQEEFKDSAWSPLLALAALSTAVANVAVVTDTSFIQVMELVQLHFQAATIGIAQQEAESATGTRLAHSSGSGEPS